MQTDYSLRKGEIVVIACGTLIALITSLLGAAAAGTLVLPAALVAVLTAVSVALAFLMNRLKALGSSMGPQVNLTISPEPTLLAPESMPVGSTYQPVVHEASATLTGASGVSS